MIAPQLDPATLLIQKFGGTSVATPYHIRRVAEKALRSRREGRNVVVVVSAMSGETNRLLSLASELSCGNADDSGDVDVVAATGEQVTAALTAMAIRAAGGRARSFLGHQVRILTDSSFNDARIRAVEAERLAASLLAGEIPVVAGFQGVDTDGNVTTLGRGGSDTTAVAVAAALGAPVCEIFTDVDGVYSADPNICEGAHKLEAVSYQEMLSLAALGGKVLHPRSVALAMRYGVPVHVRSSFTEVDGTWVRERSSPLEATGVTGLAVDKNLARVTLEGAIDPGLAGAISEKLAARRIPISEVHWTETSLGFLVRRTDLAKALPLLEPGNGVPSNCTVKQDESVARVSAVGHGLGSNPAAVATVARLLGQRGIAIQSVTTSETSLSMIVAHSVVDDAMRVLHHGFGLDQEKHQPFEKGESHA